MSKDSGGTPTVFMLAMLAGMFTQQGFQGKGMKGFLVDATTMHQRLISEHMRQDQGGKLSAMIDNAWQGGGTPAVQGSVAFGMDPTFNTMMELEDGQGGVDQAMHVAFFEDQAAYRQGGIDMVIGRHTAEAKEEPGDGHIGIAAEMWQAEQRQSAKGTWIEHTGFVADMPEIIRQERTLEATGYSEAGLAA